MPVEINFKLKTNMKCGPGVSENLGTYIQELGFTKIGVIIDRAVSELDITKKMLRGLEKAGIRYEIFHNNAAEPDYDYLEEFKQRLQGKGLEVLLGVGGGSTLDLAKGTATLLTNAGKAIEYRGFPKLKNRPLPVIAVPTTAGSGSEVTYNAVFTDTKEKRRLGINSEYNYPILAILDPLFTVGCPKAVTASSGADALVHTLESYVHKNHTVISRMYSKEAFCLLYNNLTKVFDDMGNIEVRMNISLGAYFAGIALINAGSGPAGAFSYPLGAVYKVPHGCGGGIFLTSIIKLNIQKGYQDYSELHDLIEGVDKNLTTREKNIRFLEHMQILMDKMGIPRSLSHYGLDQQGIDFMISQCDVLKTAIAQNPVEITREDVVKIMSNLK